MLTISVLAKCVIFCFFVFLYTMIIQQRTRKAVGMTFNSWQTIFFLVGALILLENQLYEIIPSVWTISSFIIIDIVVWTAAMSVTERMALTKDIARQYNRAISEAFFLNKISFSILIYAVTIASKIISVTSADMIEQTRIYLWMYEMPISPETYITNYIAPLINQKLSLQTIVSLSCALGLAGFVIPWYFSLKTTMTTKHQVYFNLCLSFLLSSYNQFIYGLTALKDIVATSFLFTFSLCLWFWFFGEYSPKKIQSI